MHESQGSSFHLQKRTIGIDQKAPLSKDEKANQLGDYISKAVNLLKTLSKDTVENAHFRTDLNKPVLKCVLSFARAIDKHSTAQVRNLLFNLLETLTLEKQNQSKQSVVLNQQANLINEAN